MTVALHLVGGRWRGVALRRNGGGTRLVDTKLFAATGTGASAASAASSTHASNVAGPADQHEILHWIEAHHPGRVIAVLPASRTICRACSLPKGTPERLQQALDLQAETHLLGAVPGHRLATVVLPAASGEAGRTGLIIGWPEGAAPMPSPLPGASATVDLHWTADVAALAALLGELRPEEPLVWMNRDDGSVAIALTGAQPVGAEQQVTGAPPPSGATLTFRATREEFATDDEWRADVRRAVAETALSADLPASTVRMIMPALEARLARAPGSALLLPESVRQATRHAVAGIPADGADATGDAWWNDFGIALGAALCASGELAALARLRESQRRERPTILARMASSLAQPHTAALLALLAVFMVAVGPLAFARLRLGVLESKVTDLEELRAQNTEDMQLRAMYRELGSQTYPMTKLAGDIANCTPEGIELTSIDIAHQGISLIGIARPAKDKSGAEQQAGDRVSEMTRLMDESGLFEALTRKTEPGTVPNTIKVTITAKVRDAFRPVDWKPDDDFAVASMAERKYGKKAAGGSSSSGRAAHGSAGADETNHGRASANERSATHVPDEGAEGHVAEGDGPESAVASAAGKSANVPGNGRRRVAPENNGARATRPPAAAGAKEGEKEATREGSKERSKDASAASAENAEKAAQSDGAADEGAPSHSGPARRSSGDSGSSGGAATRGGRSGPGGNAVPDPLSEEEINAKSYTELTEALTRIAEARVNPSVDKETKDRLQKEFNLILKRQRELKK